MHKMTLLAGVALLAFAGAAVAQTDVATDITNAQVQKVLKEQPKATDHTLRVLDMGSIKYPSQLCTAAPPIVRRANGGPGLPRARRRRAVRNVPRFRPAPSRSAGGISHDDTAETYIVISGSGTLVTGGQIMNGRRSGPDSEVTKILNGPSCSGQIVGDYVARKMSVGDISVIPAGLPHGWTDITNHVTYLSVRPDPKKVLEHGYVNPALK